MSCLVLSPTAIVVGASRGIGETIAHTLAHDGFDLVLISRDKRSMDRVKAALLVAYPNRKIDIQVCGMRAMGMG